MTWPMKEVGLLSDPGEVKGSYTMFHENPLKYDSFYYMDMVKLHISKYFINLFDHYISLAYTIALNPRMLQKHKEMTHKLV